MPVATMFAAGLANWAYVGPATTKIMKARKHQGTTYTNYGTPKFVADR